MSMYIVSREHNCLNSYDLLSLCICNRDKNICVPAMIPTKQEEFIVSIKICDIFDTKSPMLVTPLPIVTLVKLLQPLNALLTIE